MELWNFVLRDSSVDVELIIKRERERRHGSRGEKGETHASHRRFCSSKPRCRRRSVHYRSPPPLLVVLNCCTVVAAIRVTGNMAVITGTTIGVTVISIQPFVLVWHTTSRCCVVTGAAVAPFSQLFVSPD
ncbi:uncharacterized protein LOC107608298 [Arachis ipaensis]|uniref:uncharacterized protein LOC107608298 n=1 Tax=Arachis ipaensis TaxID=130454 RepID=UPI000A2B4562|nr:uncharacterized protein LOC107608298 [Arachis ipaensis]